jgi:hypothetical protein
VVDNVARFDALPDLGGALSLTVTVGAAAKLAA